MSRQRLEITEREAGGERQYSALLVGSRHLGWTAVRSLLHDERLVRPVDEAWEAKEAVEKAAALQPDAILVAGDVEGAPIVTLVRQLREASEGSTILVFGGEAEGSVLLALQSLGVSAFLLWADVTEQSLRDTLRLVLTSGLRVGSPLAVDALVAREERRAPRAGEVQCSAQERTVLDCLARGMTEHDIIAQGQMGERTVERVVSTLKEELKAPSLFVLGMRARELGLVG